MSQDGEEVGWSRHAALPDSEQNQNQIECNVTWETRLDQPRRVCRARMANERPSRQGPTNQKRGGGEGGGVIRGLGECVWSCCWDGRGLPNKWGILDEILPYYSCGMSRDVNHSLLQLGQNGPNWNIILIQSKTRVGTIKRDPKKDNWEWSFCHNVKTCFPVKCIYIHVHIHTALEAKK